MMIMVIDSSIHVFGYCIVQENYLSAFICILYAYICVWDAKKYCWNVRTYGIEIT